MPDHNVVIGWRNYARAATVLGYSTQLATLPASNILSQRLGQKWRTSTSGAAHVRVDLGSTQAIGLVAVIASNLSAAGYVRVRGSVTEPLATSSLSMDSGSRGGEQHVDPVRGLVLIPVAGNARYLRVDLTDASLSWIEAGHLFIGNAWQPTHNYAFGWQSGKVGLSSRIVSEGGAVWTDVRPTRRREAIRLQALVEDDLEAARALVREVNEGTDVLLSLRPTWPDAVTWALFGQLDELPVLQADTPATRSMGLSVTERI